MEFNFEGTEIDTLCKITSKRGLEIAGILAGVAYEIENNHLEYSFVPEKADEGTIGMHKGKILKRFMESVTDPQEQIFVVMLFDMLTDAMASQVKKKRIMEAVNGGLKNFLDAITGKEPNKAQ